MTDIRSKLAKESDHKTRQAQKLLHKLKQKHQKQKQHELQFKNQIILPSPSQTRNRQQSIQSFRTCINYQQDNLAELYFKIFNQHMKDPAVAATELQNCLQNMQKQLINLNSELKGQKQRSFSLVQQNQFISKQIQLANKESAMRIQQLNKQLDEERQKYLELLTSSDPQNTSLINTTVLVEGYEEKIKQLSSCVEEKDHQYRAQAQKLKNIISQKDILEKEKKGWKREQLRLEAENKNLIQLVGKLTAEIEQKFSEEDCDVKNREQQNQMSNIKQVEGQILSLNEKNQQKIEQIVSEYKHKMNKLQNSLTTITLTLEEQKQKSSHFKFQYEQIKEQQQQQKLQTLNQESQQIQEIKTLSNKKIEQIEKIQQQNQAQFNKELEEMKNKYEKQQALDKNLLEKYIAIIQNHKQENEQLSRQKQRLKADNEKMKNDLEGFIEQLEELRLEMEELEHRSIIMKQQNRQLIIEREQLRQQIKQFYQNKESDNVNNTKDQQINNLSSKVHSLQQQIFSKRQLINQITKQKQQSHQQILSLKQQQQEKRKKINEHNNDQIKALKVRNNTLDEQNKNLQKQNKQIMHQLNNKNEQIRKLQKDKVSKMESKQKENDDKDDQWEQVTILKDKLQMIQKQNEKLLQKVEIIEESKKKQKTNYIQTIQCLTKQLNQSYRKYNMEKVSKNSNNKQTSPDGRNRQKSLNKLKSYFGFGGTDNQ